MSFACEPGTVTGFLGPNGAGKSTTMRMICGLTPPSAGHATVNGVPFSRLSEPGRQVGVLLDASAQHSGRTGRETLAVSAQMMGLDLGRVAEVLAQVGLDEVAARRRVGKYSLGMRQRLGIANALLGEPSVLILDEPANGLDPEGIFWMRGLLRDFADRGGTVLLSSHLLREVEAVADQLVIIGGGQIVSQGDQGGAAGRQRRACPRRRPARAAGGARARRAGGDRGRRRLGRRGRRGRGRGRPPWRPASCSPSCGPPTAVASKTCSCN